MILLDTNVVSELMKPEPVRNASVVAWLRSLPPAEAYTTALTVAAIFAGVESAPPGRRRDDMMLAAHRIIGVFEGRILPFDAPAARGYGSLKAARRAAGLHHDHAFDLQIAAIASHRNCAVTTRDVSDFAGLGVELINPWDHPAS